MRLGILGGTFDPVHIGHLVVAEYLREELPLDEVLFVPAGDPWHKTGQPVTPAALRLEMLELAVAGNPGFEASRVDVERQGPTYSVDTIGTLRQRFGERADFFFILGIDSLATLPTWHEAQRFIEMCRLVAMRRPGHRRVPWAALERDISGLRRRVRVVDVPQIEVSATEIRERVASGRSIRYLVPDAVARYIDEHCLYRERP